jgi:hypothetical protein
MHERDLSCTAANAKSLTTKALALHSKHDFLQQQHVDFPQNGRIADISCMRTHIPPNR